MKRFYTLFVILLTLNSSLNGANADETQWMPDANLRTAVRSALNLNNNDTLTQAGMANLTRLTARNAQISSLTGLEHATNLTSLDLRDNTISNISALSGLTDLESLKLKGNNISSVSAFSRLTNLTLLNLKENNISSISTLSGLTNLEHLRVNANSITDVQPLTSLVNLEKLWIAGNSLTNAHLLSSLTGLTYIDIPIPDPPDTTAPSVTVSVPSGVQNGAFDITITFTEAVSGFVQSDLSLSGTASASITAWNTTDNTTYTATITPTSSGSVTLSVSSGVATDVANNPNTAATSQTVRVDVDAPSVTISVPSGDQTGAFDATITFTEAVSGFEQPDLSLTGTANASTTAWSTTGNTTYIATITPTTEGTVIINVPANVVADAAGNNNSASTAQIVTVKFKDTQAPTVTISVPAGVQNGAFAVSFIFSEVVSVFEDDEVSLTGTASATITAWDTTDKITYTAAITPTTSGEVIINVPTGIAADAARNPNTAATPQTVHVDVDSPPVTIGVPSGTQTGAFDATITFSETVSGFTQSDVSLTGSAASLTAWRTDDNNTVYTATITPTASGTVTVAVAADVATDAANNANTAATSQTVTVDIDAPGVSISVPSGTQPGAFNVIITFTEVVSNFVQSDVSLTGITASITAWSANTANTVYTATVTPTASGTVTVDVAANVATDAANNSNTAATSKTVTISIPVLVSIPDAALAVLVRTELGLAANAAITTADMRRLTSLGGGSARRLGISNLTGLEHATNLESLTLPRNNISDLSPLENLTSLRSLSLSRNSISNLTPLTNLTGLTSLGLKQNSISDLSPLSGLTKLNSLVLKNNSFTDVSPLGNLVAEDGTTNLATLLLQHNSIANTAANATALGALSDAGTNIDIAIPDVDVNAAPLASENIPAETLLLTNYPNPFNPETWIPYHLANASDVQITIYDTRGTVVRRLHLGHQREGYYTRRSHAAYWDGRNGVGERVASGIYFYQLQADEVSPLRKMLILK